MTEREIDTARQRMETYVGFVQHAKLTPSKRQFYIGAAAAINDLLCVLGHGDAVLELIAALTADDDVIE